MASEKTINQYKDKIAALADSVQAEELLSKIQKDSKLDDNEKQGLGILTQTKINEIQQNKHDEAIANGNKEEASKALETGDPEQKDEKGNVIESKRKLSSEDEREEERGQKPMHVPSGCKKKIVDTEELIDLQKKGVLMGSRPVPNGKLQPVKHYAILKGLAVILALVLGMSPISFASYSSTDEAMLGNQRWNVTSSGHLVPGADSTYNIGASGNEVSSIYADTVYSGGRVAETLGVSALTSSASITAAPAGYSVLTLTPAHTGNIVGSTTGMTAGHRFSIVFTTSGTTSYTLTFTTNFKTTGTLATGTVSGKVFVMNFVYDGTNINEVSRTTAM